MTITLRQLLLILGGTLALIGLLLGFLPISYDGSSCGFAFGSRDAAWTEALTRSMTGGDGIAFDAGCTDARSGRRTIALVLLIPGALLATIGAVMSPAKNTDSKATTTA